jgi:hypothetical protein
MLITACIYKKNYKLFQQQKKNKLYLNTEDNIASIGCLIIRENILHGSQSTAQVYIDDLSWQQSQGCC